MSQKRVNMIVCGHIDHGKSTFVGRLLTELGLIPKDRLDYLQSVTKEGQKLEYSQLVDALADEKSKGITIGLSQLAFKYQDQNYAFYDAPGHFEFLQNMITGAARADVAFLLVDAKEGLKESTLRHLYALSFIGVKEVVVLINKMDLVNYSEQRFVQLTNLLKIKMHELKMDFEIAIPIVAITAENFRVKSPAMPWYSGPLIVNILSHFHQCAETNLKSQKPTRFIVQDVFAFVDDTKKRKVIFGELLQGEIIEGKDYSVFCNSEDGSILLSAKETVAGKKNPFPLYQTEQQKSFEIESNSKAITRGALIYENYEPKLLFSNQIKCSVFWFSPTNLGVGDKITIKIAKQEMKAEVTALENVFDCDNLTYQHADHVLQKGRVAICYLKTEKTIFFDHFVNDPKLGRLILIKNNIIAGAGKIRG